MRFTFHTYTMQECESVQKTISLLHSQLEQRFGITTHQNIQTTTQNNAIPSAYSLSNENSLEDFELSDTDSEEPDFLQAVIDTKENYNKHSEISTDQVNKHYDGSLARLRDALRSSSESITTGSHNSSLHSSQGSIDLEQATNNGQMGQLQNSSSSVDNSSHKQMYSSNQDIPPTETPSLESMKRLMQWNEEMQKNNSPDTTSASFEVPNTIEIPAHSFEHQHSSNQAHPVAFQECAAPVSVPTQQEMGQTNGTIDQTGINESEIIPEEAVGQFVLVGDELKLINPSTGYPIDLPEGISIVPEHCSLPVTIPVPALDDGSFVLPDGTQFIPVQVEPLPAPDSHRSSLNPLRTVVVDRDAFEEFYCHCESNTARRVATMGLLVGPKPIGIEDTLYIQSVVIPKQLGTDHSSTIIHEHELDRFLTSNNLAVFGWIIIHLKNNIELTPMDQHIQFQLQHQLPESIAVVLSVHAPEK